MTKKGRGKEGGRSDQEDKETDVCVKLEKQGRGRFYCSWYIYTLLQTMGASGSHCCQ
jgi:hypothetical protein